MFQEKQLTNSNFIQIISDFIHPLQDEGINGIRPVDKKFDTMKTKKKDEKKQDMMFDSLKIAYISKMIDESPNTKFIFVVSPILYGMDLEQLQPVMDMCKRKNIPFIDFSNNPKYVHNNKYFYDGSHMNANGGDEFTCDLVRHIQTIQNGIE